MDIHKRIRKRAKRRLQRLKKRAKQRLLEKEEEAENELHCEDLLTEILIRASAKTVGRCMCVNKRFNSLISNPNFMDRRSSRPLITDVDGLFHFSKSSAMIYFLPFDNNSSSSYTNHLPPQGLFADDRRRIILASCSGFLLLTFLDDLTNYYLCNPTTKKPCLCIPKFKQKQLLSPKYGSCYWAGLCIIESSSFQHVTNVYSYKLVFVYYDTSQRYRFIMYSKETGKWKLSNETIACAYSNLCDWNNSVYYHGALHWLREEGDGILAFHVQKEQARMIHIPENVSFRVQKSGSSYQDVWFGATPRDDLLNMVLVSGNQVVIWVLGDYDNMKWHVKRRIETDWIDSTTSLPKFFDGKILVMVEKKIKSGESITFDAHNYEEKKIIFDAHIYNILTGERNTKKLPLWLDGCRVFVPRTNTLMDL